MVQIKKLFLIFFFISFGLNSVLLCADELKSIVAVANAIKTTVDQQWAYLSELVASKLNVDIAKKNYSDQYLVNLMWINRRACLEQTHIYPQQHEAEYLATIMTWAQKSQGGNVNVWFDGELLSQQAIENTKSSINQEIIKQRLQINVTLKDIRELSRVKEDPEILSPEIPVFFRTDLARALIIEENIKNGCVICADFDVKPMTKKELFDKETVNNLDKHGFVMARESNKLGFENSFQMFVYKEELLKAMKLMIIKANCLRAKSFLEEAAKRKSGNSFFSNPGAWKMCQAGFQENVYYSYPLMYNYFHQLQNISPLILLSSETPYSKENDGKDILDEYAKVLMFSGSAFSYILKFPMPTKKVSIPPSVSLVSEFTS